MKILIKGKHELIVKVIEMIELKAVNERLFDIFKDDNYVGAINNYRGSYGLSSLTLAEVFDSDDLKRISGKLDELNKGEL